jgi:hypothetical protein
MVSQVVFPSFFIIIFFRIDFNGHWTLTIRPLWCQIYIKIQKWHWNSTKKEDRQEIFSSLKCIKFNKLFLLYCFYKEVKFLLCLYGIPQKEIRVQCLTY